MKRSRLFVLALVTLAVGALIRAWTAVPPDTPPLPPHLEQLARETPDDDADAQAKLASAVLHAAEHDPHLYPRALGFARRALALQPERTDAALLVLRVLQETRQFQEMYTLARELAAQHPQDASLAAAVGDAALALGRYEAADVAYQRLWKLDASAATATRLSHLRRMWGDARGAIQLLEPIVRTEDAAEPLAMADALCEFGEAHLAEGNSDTALRAFALALSRERRFARAHLGRGHIHLMRGENAQAISAYKAALVARPRPSTRARLADALTAAGWTVEGKAHYRWALQDSREHDPRFHAQLLLDLGQELPRAEALAREEYERRQDVHTEGLLAYALVLNGKVDEAEAAATRALRLGTRDARLSYVAGLVASARGDTEAARGHLTTALQSYPPLPPALRARAHALIRGDSDETAREPIH